MLGVVSVKTPDPETPRVILRTAQLGNMTAIGFLSVAPVKEGSMSEDVAKAVEALEDFDISYETTPMGTIIEAETASEVFEASKAAHEAVEYERVSTFLKIDDKRESDKTAREKVESVEKVLGREAKSED